MPRLEKCPKCESSKIAKKLVVFEDSENYNSSFKPASVGYLAKPDALILKQKVMSSFSAEACTDCGFMEFYVDQPYAFRDRVGGN
ncbi:MAG: putative nucleic-acid-binding Zn-ribbon protein [Akkermansiaceae bacterium]|jgi:predicted nucleic-acid-binding Zn-ribbon protein